jgi:hypothetical protein
MIEQIVKRAEVKANVENRASLPWILITEGKLRRLALGLTVSEAQKFARLLEVAEGLLGDALESGDRQFGGISLRVLRQLKRESPGEKCKRFMEVVIVGSGKGLKGIEKAYNTVRRFVEVAFEEATDKVVDHDVFDEIVQAVKGKRRRAA